MPQLLFLLMKVGVKRSRIVVAVIKQIKGYSLNFGTSNKNLE